MIVEIGVIVLCGIIVYYYWFFYTDYESYYTFPKKIWTYLPPLRNRNLSAEYERTLCVEQWKKDHPDMDIIVLTQENCQGYLRIPPALLNHPILKEDPERWMRLLQFFALTEHGGIWMDSSMITQGDLRTWIMYKHADLVAFHSSEEKETTAPSIDPGWIACTRAHPFVEGWKREWLKLLEYPSAEEYVEARRSWGVPIDSIADPLGNTTEVALQTLYQFYPPSMEGILIRPMKDATAHGLRRLSVAEKKERAHAMADSVPIQTV